MITKTLADVRSHFPIQDPNMSFEVLSPFIKRAKRNYLDKYIGKDQYKTLEDYTGPDEEIALAIFYAQEAEVNLAMFEYLNFAGIQVTGSGVHVVAPDNSTAAPRKDIRDALRSAKKIGLNAVDALLLQMLENIDKFSDYESSIAYKQHQSLLVNSTAVFQTHYNIFNSVQTYMSLVPELKTCEPQFIVPVIGNEVLEAVKKPADNLSDEHLEVVNQVKEKLQAANVFFCVSKTLGSGLYYQSSTGFQMRFDILDYERNVTDAKVVSETIKQQKTMKYDEALNFLKAAKKLVVSNTEIFTMYQEPEANTVDPFVASQGNVFL